MASKVSLEELRSQVLPSELYPRELGGCFIFLSPLLVTFWKWSNLTTSFHMGWSHQLDYVQSIHVFSLSPAPSPWFWSSDFQNCHRGSGIGVVTCLKYHDIMTKSCKSHTLIPMLTPVRKQTRQPATKITTWPRGKLWKADQVEKQLQQAAQKAEAALQAREAFAAEVPLVLLLLPKVTGCRGSAPSYVFKSDEVEATFIKLHVSLAIGDCHWLSRCFWKIHSHSIE